MPGDAGLQALPSADDLAFMRRLSPKARHAVKVPGGSEQRENATRQRCRRRGWVLFRDTGEGFGWMLTKDGRAALVARDDRDGAAGGEGTGDGG